MIWLILSSLCRNQCTIMIIRFRCANCVIEREITYQKSAIASPAVAPLSKKIWSCFCLYLYTDITIFVYTCYMTYAKATNIYPETSTSAAENSSTTNNPPTPTGMQSDTPLKYPCFCLFFYACMNLTLLICILVIWLMAKQQILIQRQPPQLLRIHQQPTTHQQVCNLIHL